jgi:hypothetical protein
MIPVHPIATHDIYERLGVSSQKVAAYCRANHIVRLAVFGSITRDDFNDNSDVDLLVEFDPRAAIGWEIVDIQDGFAAMFGRPVDLLTYKGINKYMRDTILSEARVVYEQS